MAATAAKDHRQPLRRARPAGDARAARRRARAAVARSPRSRSSPGRWAGLKALASPALGSARPRLRAQRHRLHRQRARACSTSPRRWWASITARPRLDRRRAGAWYWHQQRGNRREHPAPLRRLQRLLPAVARPADGLFLRVFPSATASTLDEAQAQKLDHICRKLRLQPRRALPRHRLRLGRR